MEWVETTGKTLEEAKDAALDQLGVDETEAEFEILDEPRSGLFGRVRGEARIRARIQPTQPRPKVERRDRRKREAKSRGNAGDQSQKGTAAVAATVADDGSPPAAKNRSTRSTGSSRPTKAKAKPTSDQGAPRAARSESPRGGQTMSADDVTVEEQATLTETFLGGLVEAFGLEGRLEQVKIDDDTIEVHVLGDDLGILIGPKGQTLQAVQELSRTYIQRKATGTHHGRIRIDVAGYRQRRREALERFTRQVVEQVLESGVQKALEPMNAADRKVVHDTANSIDGVTTLSEGEDPRRRVVITPA